MGLKSVGFGLLFHVLSTDRDWKNRNLIIVRLIDETNLNILLMSGIDIEVNI